MSHEGTAKLARSSTTRTAPSQTNDICKASWVTFRPRCKITCFRLPANLPWSLPGRQKRPRSKLCVARAHHRLTKLFHGLEVHLLAFRAPRARPGARRKATCCSTQVDELYRLPPDSRHKRLGRQSTCQRNTRGCLMRTTKGRANVQQRKMFHTS